jgi:hypothetical protein
MLLVGTQTELVEYSGNQGAGSPLGRRQEPMIIEELGKLDLATAKPSTLRASDHEHGLVEQRFGRRSLLSSKAAVR